MPTDLAPQGTANPNYNQSALGAGSLDPTLSVSNISSTSPINYSTATLPSIYPVATLGATNSAGSATPALTETPQEQKQSQIAQQLAALNTQESGKGQFQADQYKQLGFGMTYDANGNIIPDPGTADLTAKLTGLQNEAQAIPIQLQTASAGRGITAGGLAPIQSAALRDNAVAALGVSALIAAKNGQLATAEHYVNNATIQKFGPIEAQISAAKANLELIKNDPLTSLQDRNRAQAQLDIQNKKEVDIAQQKADYTAVQNIALEAAKNGADVATLAAIQATKTPNAAILAAGKSLATAQTEIIKNADGSSSLIDKRTGSVIKRYGGGAASDINSGASVVRTVQTTNGAQPVNGYTLSAGDDPYFIAQQNGTDMATLKRLNPTITDWTKLPVGAVINLPNKEEAWLSGKTSEQIQAYNSLPSTEKASIKQLVNGEALLTDIVKSRGAQTQSQINKIISQATAIDPSFSINANKQRYAYKTQYNNPNGKEQLQINSINTTLGHLAEFKTASDALGNTVALPYNKLVNYLKTNIGDPNVARLNTVITALAGELASVYKGGTAPTDQETEQWRNSILASFSKSQASGVAGTASNLISNKLQSLAQSYKNIMGSYPDSSIINPDQLQQLIDSGVDTSAITSALQKQGYNPPTTLSTGAVNNTLSSYGLGNVNSILGHYGL